MKRLVFLFPFIFTLLHFSSCYYDAEDELYLEIECDTSMTTYSGVVLPIIQQNCYGCHSQAANQGGINLEGYSNLKTLVDAELLLGVIKHQSGFSPMPKNAPKMLDCKILQIETWINQGAQNN